MPTRAPPAVPQAAAPPPAAAPLAAPVVPAATAGGAEEQQEEEEEGYYEEEEGGEEEEEAREEEEGYEEEGGEEEGGEEEAAAGEEEEGYEEEAGEEEEGEEEGAVLTEALVAATASAVTAAAPSEKAIYARCVYNYAAEKEGDLSLKTGSYVTMSAQQNFAGDWLYGAIGDSAPGYFPASFVKLVSEAEATGGGGVAGGGGELLTLSGTASAELTDSQMEDKQPAQSGWRLERDQLKTRLGAQEAAEAALRAEVAALERQRGDLLQAIAELRYGAGRGKGGCVYDLDKLSLGTALETDAMGQAVDSSTEMSRQLKEFAALVEKSFEKEKDVAAEKDAALKAVMVVLNSAAAEMAAISALSNTKDKFSHVLRAFRDKIDAESE
jgi:hypothetical protein